MPADFAVHEVPSRACARAAAGSAYHFRVVTSNAFGGGKVAKETFTTQGAGGGGALLDGRRWEMVTPPDKHGALVEPVGLEHVTQASADGRAVTFLTDAPTEAQPAGYANLVQVLADRGSAGWQARDIAGAHATPTGIAVAGQEFRFFSEDLSLGVVQPLGGFTAALSDQASELTPYVRKVFSDGDVLEACLAGGVTPCYTPVVSGCPGEGAPCLGDGCRTRGCARGDSVR